MQLQTVGVELTRKRRRMFPKVSRSLTLSCGLAVLQLVLVLSPAAAVPWNSNVPVQESRDAQSDLVASLPGWNKTLPSRWFSGYIKSAAEMFSHYIYIEREQSATNTAFAAPLVLWSNGGPGASSMFGLLTEIGPFMLSEESLESDEFRKTGVPSLIRNPFNWAKFADILVFDAPPPVGFSFCLPDGPSGEGTSCGSWNDTRVADVNYAALQGFYAKFPHLRERDLYLMGESYAGVYIPMLARNILEKSKGKIKLRGFAVGDPCAGTSVSAEGENLSLTPNAGTKVICGDSFGPYWEVEFMQGHQQFSRELYEEIISTCGIASLQRGDTTPACNILLGEMWREIGGYYDYSLYDDCTYDDAYALWGHGAQPGYTRWRPTTKPARRKKHTEGDASVKKNEGGGGQGGEGHRVGGALNDYPCGTAKALGLWVAEVGVRRALHVPIDANFFNADNGNGFKYELTEENLLPFYHDVAVGRWAAEGVRVLIYNGDTDPAINPLATQNWTVAIGLPERETWRPWTLDACRRMGGYVTRYQGNLDFLTIRGSGHMVPTYKPEAAMVFMSAWISDSNFPIYNASCTKPTPH